MASSLRRGKSLRIFLCGLASLLVAAVAAAPATAIPTGTFKIRSFHGTCLTVEDEFDGAGIVRSRACSPLNLNQQFFHTEVGKHLLPVVGLVTGFGGCLAVPSSEGGLVQVVTCASGKNQEWRSAPTEAELEILPEPGDERDIFSVANGWMFTIAPGLGQPLRAEITEPEIDDNAIFFFDLL